MKTPLESFINRMGRFAVVAAFGLSAALATAQDGRSTVISTSPAGSSSLSWKKPVQQVMPVTENAADPLFLTIPEDSMVQEAESNVLPIAETTQVVQYASENTSPIRPVRLLQMEMSQTAVPEPDAAAMTADMTAEKVAQVSDGYGRSAPLPQGHSAVPTARDRMNESGYVEECPDPKSLASIQDLSYKVTLEPGLFPESCPLPDEVYYRKAPTPITFTWKASALCHKPLYFEDVQLERYGHSCCPVLQPICSGVRFWLTIPILPYLMGTYPPNECIYDLGYYRPGSCAPHMLQPIPISLRGGLIQAGATVGFFYIFP